MKLELSRMNMTSEGETRLCYSVNIKPITAMFEMKEMYSAVTSFMTAIMKADVKCRYGMVAILLTEDFELGSVVAEVTLKEYHKKIVQSARTACKKNSDGKTEHKIIIKHIDSTDINEVNINDERYNKYCRYDKKRNWGV